MRQLNLLYIIFDNRISRYKQGNLKDTMSIDNSLKSFQASNRQEWRNWLMKNHQQSQGVWLIYYKVKSKKPSIRYSEAVREALCFGWIDSKIKSLDEERYKQIFTPRRPKSVWSKLNKQYVRELIQRGLMTEAGFKAIEIAKQNGSWTALDAVEALIIPDDLQRAFLQHKTAAINFEKLSNSKKKNILFSISSAKRPQTRVKRIQQAIDSLANHF